MKRYVMGGIILLATLSFLFLFVPMKEGLVFTETRTEKPNHYYVLLNEEQQFEIRYVHSIHLTDVIEKYAVTKEHHLRLLEMSYENLAIGMPSEAGEGETLQLKDGVYTLQYSDRVIDSFRIHIGRVDEDLALRYKGNEIDLKKHLVKGNSYEFQAKKLSYYQLWKGERLDG
ncbi:MAG TPA: DUF1850 domain-containing protein [Sporosarcina sp.]|nr:DUF1850 domain-containing protein [Sporosarcina sp.]